MDFEPMWLNLIQGFTFREVYQQESEVKVNGVPQENKDTLSCYVFEKDNVMCEVIVSENERIVLDVAFYVNPDYLEIKKREEGELSARGEE